MKAREETGSKHIARTLLERAHTPSTSTELFESKVKQRKLHLAATTRAPASNAQEARRAVRLAKASLKRRKPAALSSREKRALRLYHVPVANQKYAVYEPLREMWNAYILEVLSNEEGKLCLPVTAQMTTKLCAADYHGSYLRVVRSGCVSRVGIVGIVIKDSRGAFEIITASNKIKVVPKENTTFEVRLRVPRSAASSTMAAESTPATIASLDNYSEVVFEIIGNNFMHRAADRATKKFRWHFSKDL